MFPTFVRCFLHFILMLFREIVRYTCKFYFISTQKLIVLHINTKTEGLRFLKKKVQISSQRIPQHHRFQNNILKQGMVTVGAITGDQRNAD